MQMKHWNSARTEVEGKDKVENEDTDENKDEDEEVQLEFKSREVMKCKSYAISRCWLLVNAMANPRPLR